MGARLTDPAFLIQGPRPKQPTPSRAKTPKPLPKKRAEPRRTDAGHVTGGQKLIPIVTDPDYIADIHSDVCAITGLPGTHSDPIVAAHVGNPGKGLKNDAESLPMLDSVHRGWHNHGPGFILDLLKSKPAIFLMIMRSYARERYFGTGPKSSEGETAPIQESAAGASHASPSDTRRHSAAPEGPNPHVRTSP